jgi:DNA (cytosine-5)-methyltransferase 1
MMQAGGNSTGGTRPYGTTVDTCEALIPSTFNEDGTARTLTARYDSSPCVDRGPDVVGTLRSMSHHGSHANGGGQLAVAFDTTQLTSPHNYSNPQPGDPCHPLAAGAHPPAVAWSIMPMNSGKDYKARETEVAQPIMAGGPVGGNQGGDFVLSSKRTKPPGSIENISTTVAIGFYANEGTHGAGDNANMSPTLKAHPVCSNLAAVATQSAVRRLTPVECERLQGFPDNFTAIPWRKKGAEDCPDGPRYKALGNSMAVPVMRWIGERIQLVDDFVSLF